MPAPVPAADEVVVRVHACGICGSDLHWYLGDSAPPPVCLGHEICGVVTADVGGFHAGESVVVEPIVGCGTCPHCLSGRPNLCPTVRILGLMAAGGFADAVAVPTSALYRLPSGLDLDTAVLAEPLAVAVHAVGLARVRLGTEVLVLGGGAIGLLAARAAARSGGRVTVSARYPQQHAMATALGAATTIAGERDAVLAHAARHAPEVVLETVGGVADTVRLALEAVRAGGTVVALGVFTRSITFPPLPFLMKEARLISSMVYDRRGPRTDFETALGLLRDDRELLARVVTHRVPLADIARAFELAAHKSSGAIKVAVTPAAG